MDSIWIIQVGESHQRNQGPSRDVGRCFSEAKTQEGADALRDKGIALIEAAVERA